VLTPANIRTLYGVEADVHRHPATGRLVVVPLGRTTENTAV
jgi:ABC-type cobalamin/Fe3+-siderophores transport system ATPase subunit